ncbi:MAG: type II secretion system F family protein [Planctomycetes bacterium]|nr:type II secretion system F family protein [Planctomycetota bacterium]
MPLDNVTILVFVAIALVAAFVLLIARATLAGESSETSAAEAPTDKDLSVEEMLSFEHRSVLPGPVGSFDRWFGRLTIGSGISAISGVLLMILCGLLGGGIAFFSTNHELAGILGAVVGLALGLGILLIQRRRRLQQFDEQLPEVLEVLARAVRAGRSFDQAVDLVAQSTLRPASTELAECSRKLKLGLSVEGALKNLASRIPLPDVSMFSAVVSMQRRTGGRLATTLERLAQAARDRQGYRRQVRTATAGARWSSGIILTVAILMGIYLFGWQPAYIQSFLTTQIGQMVLITAVLLQVLGITWIFIASRPEY